MKVMPTTLICPSCGAEHVTTTVFSGNTFFGPKYYSDGSGGYLMMPKKERYKRCAECKIFFNEKSEYILLRYPKEEAHRTKPLLINELMEAVDVGLYNSTEQDMINLRIFLWREMNQLRRSMIGEGIHSQFEINQRLGDIIEVDDEIYRENCYKILSSIELEKNDKMLLIRAELWRNLGEFNKCREILNEIKQQDKFADFITTISRECDAENTITVCVINKN